MHKYENGMSIGPEQIVAYMTVKKDWIARLYRQNEDSGYYFFRYISRPYEMSNRRYTSPQEAIAAVRKHKDNRYLDIWVFNNEAEFLNWAANAMAERSSLTVDPIPWKHGPKSTDPQPAKLPKQVEAPVQRYVNF